jgi:hypothetical protein
MGASPENSVVNTNLQHWNVSISDWLAFQNASVNPTLTALNDVPASLLGTPFFHVARQQIFTTPPSLANSAPISEAVADYSPRRRLGGAPHAGWTRYETGSIPQLGDCPALGTSRLARLEMLLKILVQAQLLDPERQVLRSMGGALNDFKFVLSRAGSFSMAE